MKYTSSELWKKGSRATQGSVEAPRVCNGWELNLKMGMVQERGFTVGRRKAATGPPIYAWNTFVLNCGSLYPRSNHSHLLLCWEYWFQLVCLSDMQLRSKDSKADLSMIYPWFIHVLWPLNLWIQLGVKYSCLWAIFHEADKTALFLLLFSRWITVSLPIPSSSVNLHISSISAISSDQTTLLAPFHQSTLNWSFSITATCLLASFASVIFLSSHKRFHYPSYVSSWFTALCACVLLSTECVLINILMGQRFMKMLRSH